MESLITILTALGAIVVAGGTITGLALWLFKLFGEKWLSARFAERLETFKHERQREVEQLRFEINKLLDRTTKLHQREFETLPKAWALLTKNYHTVRGLLSALQSYPDIARMQPAQLDEFLSECPLAKWQKDELIKSPDRNKYYQEAIFWHYLSKARTACQDSGIYISENGIFMPVQLKTDFEKLGDLAWSAVIEHQINREDEVLPRLREARDKFFKDGEKLFKKLEGDVHKRLWE